MLKKERQEYKDRRNQVGSKRTIQQLQQENEELRSAAGSQPPEDALLGKIMAMRQNKMKRWWAEVMRNKHEGVIDIRRKLLSPAL